MPVSTRLAFNIQSRHLTYCTGCPCSTSPYLFSSILSTQSKTFCRRVAGKTSYVYLTKARDLHMNMALHVYEDIMRVTENLSEKYYLKWSGLFQVVHIMLHLRSEVVGIMGIHSSWLRTSISVEG